MTMDKYKKMAKNVPSLYRSDSSYAEIEDIFWNDLKNRANSRRKKKILYAIDNETSLFPVDWPFWNINNLISTESVISETHKIPGINTPFTNVSMPFTAFGIHCEDSNLASINVHHGGAPRQWYSVSSNHANKLEKLVQENTSTQFDCDLFIRHKSILIPPSMFDKNDIPLYKVGIFIYFLIF